MQVSENAEPDVEKPGLHVHVVAPGPLVLPVGQLVQEAAAAALKVPGRQSKSGTHAGRQETIEGMDKTVSAGSRERSCRGCYESRAYWSRRSRSRTCRQCTLLCYSACLGCAVTSANKKLGARLRTHAVARPTHGCRRGMRQSQLC